MWKLPQLAPLQKGFWPDPCRANSGCIAWPGTGWESSGLTCDRTGSSREPAESTQDEIHCQKLTGNYSGTSQVPWRKSPFGNLFQTSATHSEIK